MHDWRLLGYLGLIPFATCIGLSIYDTAWKETAEQAFIAYSAVILSFIAGTVWQGDRSESSGQQNLVSNIFSLAAFASLLIANSVAVWVLSGSFILLFYYETLLMKKTTTNRLEELYQYMNMRFWLTLTVVIFHMLAIYFWFYN